MAEIKSSRHDTNNSSNTASRQPRVDVVEPAKLDANDALGMTAIVLAFPSDHLHAATTAVTAKKQQTTRKKVPVPHHKHSGAKRVSFAVVHDEISLESRPATLLDEELNYNSQLQLPHCPKKRRRRMLRRNSFVIPRRRGCPFLRPNCIMTEESQKVASSLDALELAIQEEALHNLPMPSEADSEMDTELEAP